VVDQNTIQSHDGNQRISENANRLNNRLCQ
jgi:hypothetical protein